MARAWLVRLRAVLLSSHLRFVLRCGSYHRYRREIIFYSNICFALHITLLCANTTSGCYINAFHTFRVIRVRISVVNLFLYIYIFSERCGMLLTIEQLFFQWISSKIYIYLDLSWKNLSKMTGNGRGLHTHIHTYTYTHGNNVYLKGGNCMRVLTFRMTEGPCSCITFWDEARAWA